MERLEDIILENSNGHSSGAWIINEMPTNRFDEHFNVVVNNGSFKDCYDIFEMIDNPFKKDLLFLP